MGEIMVPTLRHLADQKPEPLSFDVAGYQNGRYIGPSEISPIIDTEVASATGDARPTTLDFATARAQLDALVAACGGAGERSPFGKHKEQLLTDLAPPYALFRFVKAHPDLLAPLREHDALKDRVRQIPKSKTALLCIHCKMKPGTAEERSSCSDWTIWLEQAEFEDIEPGNFMNWAMDRNFKDIRVAVRARREAARKPDGCAAVSTGRPLQLSLRESGNGASVTLGGRRFSIPKTVLKRVIALIERAAHEGMPTTGTGEEGNTHA